MKMLSTLSTFLIVVLFSIATAQAQTARPGRVGPKPRTAAAKVGGIKDGLSMQKGRVLLTELGISNPLVADKKLINGTIITPAGVVTGTNGTTAQMKEGDLVSLSGRITSRSEIVAGIPRLLTSPPSVTSAEVTDAEVGVVTVGIAGVVKVPAPV